jgi:hypothetical protein
MFGMDVRAAPFKSIFLQTLRQLRRPPCCDGGLNVALRVASKVIHSVKFRFYYNFLIYGTNLSMILIRYEAQKHPKGQATATKRTWKRHQPEADSNQTGGVPRRRSSVSALPKSNQTGRCGARKDNQTGSTMKRHRFPRVSDQEKCNQTEDNLSCDSGCVSGSELT